MELVLLNLQPNTEINIHISVFSHFTWQEGGKYTKSCRDQNKIENLKVLPFAVALAQMIEKAIGTTEEAIRIPVK